MHHVIGALAIGALGGVSIQRIKVRPAMRSLVKAGIVAQRRLEEIGSAARAQVHELVEEARADLDSPDEDPAR
jgi:hypothetical protein